MKLNSVTIPLMMRASFLLLYEVLTGSEETALPLEELFSNKVQLQTDYCFYEDLGIKILRSRDIIGLNGPSHTWKAAKYGCVLRLSYKEQKKTIYYKTKGDMGGTYNCSGSLAMRVYMAMNVLMPLPRTPLASRPVTTQRSQSLWLAPDEFFV